MSATSRPSPPGPHKSSPISSGLRWAALESAFAKVTGLISLVLVARALGPSVMGVVALVLLFMELARNLSELGLSQAIIQRQDVTREQLATLYTLNWTLGLVVFLLALVSAPVAASTFGEPQLRHLIPVAAVGFLIAPLAQQVNALLQKEMDFRTLAIRSMSGSVIGLIVAVVGVWLGFGVWAPVLAGLVTNLFTQIFLFSVGYRRGLLNGFALSIRETGPLLAFGAFGTGANVLNIVNSRIDQFIIAGTLGATAMGLYAMSIKWTLANMQKINSIATRVAFPAIARIQHDRARVRAAYLRLVNRVTTANAAFLFGVAAVASPLVLFLLGTEWEPMIAPLQLMCGYVLVRSLGNVNGPLVTGLGKADWAFYWNLVLTLVVPVIVLGASQFGSLDAIVIALIGIQIVFASLAYFFWVRRLIGPCARDYLRAIFLPWTCGAGMAGIVVYTLGFLRNQPHLLQLAVAVPVGAVSYVLLSLLINRQALTELIVLLPGGRRFVPRRAPNS
jgi:lipopolysaccharide exporter